MKNLDWNLLRAFHATATTGSLSAAARKLDLTQPSLSRQIAALEAQMRLPLFDRIGRRLVLTATGAALLDHVAQMDGGAAGFALAARAQSADLSEPVSLSVTDAFAAYTLPQVALRLQAAAPDLRLNVIVTNRFSDLHRREADIALRHAPPDTDDLRGDALPPAQAHFYASRDWIARHGMPRDWAELLRAGLLGTDDPARFARYLTAAGLPTIATDFHFCADSSVALWEMARAGLGACAMLRDIAARSDAMVQVLPDLPPIEVPFWIVTHARLYHAPRIRLVRDVLRDVLGPIPPSPGAFG